MKFNTRLPHILYQPFNDELDLYKSAFKKQNFRKAWHHLERAHIIGQAYPFSHTYVHWLMLKFAFATKNVKELIGQAPRLLVGGIKSFVGVIPLGNTGGADVPPLRPMEIPQDLKEILNRAQSI